MIYFPKAQAMRQLEYLLTLLFLLSFNIRNYVNAQDSFKYKLSFENVSIPGVSGLHSYSWAQSGGKWLIIGGRLDGIHARQPFNAFPAAMNNTQMMVIDVQSHQLWTSPVNSLPISISEQLQSSNMNFYQDDDTLTIVGGYGYSNTATDHITYPNLITIQVSNLINAIITNQPATPFIKQITDSVFAVTGGHLTKLGNEYLLIGGHTFTGRYNPMGGPTFTQSYTNEIRRFKINNSGNQLSYSNYSAVNDPIHLHRRDYNLIPQIFPNNTFGYTISSGVFQHNFDLPFLYPVDVTNNGYSSIQNFSQFLSNYHSPNIGLYDSISAEMHTLFFGGMSQYYYQNGSLIQDNEVPFVKTISRLTRYPNGNLVEYKLSEEMNQLKGAGAEFIVNPQLPQTAEGIINVNSIQGDTILIGHIYGGILSSELNPFSNNNHDSTMADPAILAVKLIRSNIIGQTALEGKTDYQIKVYPNPAKENVHVKFNLSKPVEVSYVMTNAAGDLIIDKNMGIMNSGEQEVTIPVKLESKGTMNFLTFTFDNMYYVNEAIIVP